MEKLSKCIAVALHEMGKLRFSGAATIPAGNAMSALYQAAEEVKRLEAEKAAKKSKTKESEHGG